MGKPHPLELRQRIVAFVDEGHTHREVAYPLPSVLEPSRRVEIAFS